MSSSSSSPILLATASSQLCRQVGNPIDTGISKCGEREGASNISSFTPLVDTPSSVIDIGSSSLLSTTDRVGRDIMGLVA
jgi:hypothetical protein